MHLAAPNNFCKQDIEFDKDPPFLATADEPVVVVKGDACNKSKSEMMQCSLEVFSFLETNTSGSGSYFNVVFYMLKISHSLITRSR